MYLRLNATGVLANTTVQFNPGGGLNLNQGSMAELSPLVGPNVLQSNGGGTIGDRTATDIQRFSAMSPAWDVTSANCRGTAARPGDGPQAC